jgi:hypothetical protein
MRARSACAITWTRWTRLGAQEVLVGLIIVDFASDRLAGCSEDLHDGLGPDFAVRNADCHHHPADHPGYVDLLVGRSDFDFDFASSLPPYWHFPKDPTAQVFNTFYLLPNSHTVVPRLLPAGCGGAALKMAVPARTIGNETSKTKRHEPQRQVL